MLENKIKKKKKKKKKGEIAFFIEREQKQRKQERFDGDSMKKKVFKSLFHIKVEISSLSSVKRINIATL